MTRLEEVYGAILQRLEDLECRIDDLEKKRNGHTDDEIIGILYKEIGKGTVSLVTRSLLFLFGAAGAAVLAWFGFKDK